MQEMAVLVMLSIHFNSLFNNEISFLNNKQYQAGTILEALHIRNGKLVEFIVEEEPQVNKPDVQESGGDWELGWEE